LERLTALLIALILSVTLAACESPYMAIGIKIGEVSDSDRCLRIRSTTSTSSMSQELIAYVKENTKDGMLLNILFHGVGGDHLNVSAEAH